MAAGLVSTRWISSSGDHFQNRQSCPGESRICFITPPSCSQWEYMPNKTYIIGVTTFIKPLPVLGALFVCACTWLIWRGRRIFFSDHMYATNRDLADGVSSVTKSFVRLSADVSATEEHLTQCIEKVDEKLDRQKETYQSIKDQATEVNGTVRDLDQVMEAIKESLRKINEKMDSLYENQVQICTYIEYLAQWMDGC
ncbi:uncharacterized protein [Typha angustifolia]|uniref:uncharacterized protein n=1 Tax=Typha angustifolia TaxID=59011 RepID=UPI003C2F377E